MTNKLLLYMRIYTLWLFIGWVIKSSHLPIEAKTGPSARASAPIDRKMPSTTPFWLVGPNIDAMVVRQGTVVAEAKA